MKRKVLSFLALAAISVGSISAQGEMDAYKLSQTDLTGTARSVSMGGAFGALGGDISAITINPAGIGVYRTSEIVTTLNFQNTKTKTISNLETIEDSKFKFSFDNLAFVTVFPLGNDDVPSINFGFSYNRLKSFDRKYSASIDNFGANAADYILHRFNGIDFGGSNPTTALDLKGGDTDDPYFDYDWLPVFGFNSGLIGPGTNGWEVKYGPDGGLNRLSLHEKGYVNTYDFNVGTTISDIVSLGLSLSITDLKYRMYSDLDEDYGDKNGFLLRNSLETDGTGIQVTAGVIIKPINELRIGLAYHSPTWYNMTDHYTADFIYDFAGYTGGKDGELYAPWFTYDYRMRTPDKWTASLAGVIGQTAIISLDYEYTNYKNNLKMFDDYGDPLSFDPNPFIKTDFRGASTLRAGAEVRITPQFSARVGYQWKQSPLTKEFKNNQNEVMTVGSVTHFTLDGDTNYFTYGLGYRFTKNFYTDIAFVMRNQKSDLYTFDDSVKAEWKDNTFQGLLTLGYRF